MEEKNEYSFYSKEQEAREKAMANNQVGNQSDFGELARYRCEQINTTKINGNLVQYIEQKFQYLLKLDLNKKTGAVRQEDYFKKMSPPILNGVFDFIEQTDKIRHNVVFSIDGQTGKLKKILNREELNKNWNAFKSDQALKIPFIVELRKTNEEAVQDLFKMGDIQFSLNSDNEEEYRKDFFYFTCFDQYLFSDEYQAVDFDFLSTIVPPNILPLKIRYDKISEDKGLTKIRKVGEYEMNEDLENKIRIKYDELHKSSIGYAFTAYKLILRSTIEFDTDTKIVKNAQVVLKEAISDNIENECVYTVKKLESYIPKNGQEF